MKVNPIVKRITVKILKITGWITFLIVFLLVALALLIQVPSIQNKVVQKAVSFLKGKIKTEVRLERISISFPKKIVLTGLYLEDERRDTLLYARELGIDTDLWGLTQKKIQLNQVEFTNVTAGLSRSSKDSTFNFTYIIDSFAGDSTKIDPADTTSAPWTFTLGSVEITNSQLSYKDSLNGTMAEGRIGTAEVDMDDFDLDKSIFKAGDILLKDINAALVLTKSSLPSTNPQKVDTVSVLPIIGFETLTLTNIKASYTQQASGQVLQLTIVEANVDADEIKLQEQVIELDNIRFSDSFLSYQQMKNNAVKSPATKNPSVETTPKPWKVRVNDADLSGLSLQYYNFVEPILANAIDFNHLWISKLNLKATNLSLNGNEMMGEIEQLSFFEKSGFTVSSFQTQFSLKEKSLEVTDLFFQTPGSKIDLTASAQFGSLATISDTYPKAQIEVNLKSSTLALQDLLYFQPHLFNSVPLKIKKSFTMDADVIAKGKVNDLTIEKLNVKILDSTRLSLVGGVKGLPDFNRALMNIKLNEFRTTNRNIESILPDSLLPASIHFPEWLSLGGHFKGSIQQPDVDILLKSSAGSVALNAKMNLDPKTKENYKGELKINEFSVGEILGDSTMGKLDMKASVAGAGVKLDELNAAFDIIVNHFEYKHYDYKNFKLNGSMNNYFFSGNASLEDKNLDFNIKGDLDYNEDVPKYKFTFALNNVDLQALHLTERSLKARGILEVNLVTSDFKVINGNLAIRKFGVYNGSELYMIDSLLFASIDQDGQSEISIRSDIVTGDFKGTINLYALPGAVRRHFNNYFSLKDSAYDKPVAPQNFEFKLELKNTDLLTEVLLPDLEPFVPGEIAGEFNSEEADLNLRFGISKIKYGSIGVDSIRLNVTSDEEELKYSFSVRDLSMDTLRIAGIRLSGKVASDSIHAHFAVLDSVREEKYALGGIINSLKDAFQFRFLNDELLLNYEEWKTPEDNYLQFRETGLQPHHFEIVNGNEKIALQKKEGVDSVISLIFTQLELKNITSLVQGITPIAGKADGDFNISVAERGAFNSKLKIEKFTILGQEWGDLSLAMSQKPNSPYDINLEVQGENVVLKIAGSYSANATRPGVDLVLDVQKINLAAFQPLTLGQIKRMEGLLVGEIKVKGEVSSPAINGSLTFKNATIVPSAVNSAFILKEETLTIKESGLVFSNFTIRDEKNNMASIDGTIGSANFKSFRLNLDVKANDFQMLNSTYDDNKLFYGKVSVTTRMRIRGSADEPRVSMDVSLGDKSNFTFVVPQSEKGIQDQKGIVTFVDKDAETDPFLAGIVPNDTLLSAFKGMDLTANIELSGGETFNIVLDPASGDQLSVRGKSDLTLKMDPAGEMQLTGRYEIVSGTYDFSFYKLVRRNFIIEKGSVISWLGDPMEAQLDIRALYKIDTSPMELVSNQIDIVSPTELNTYRQRLPFLVYLMIKGDMLSPEITFKLDMPIEKQNAFGGNIYATIQDLNTRESDLNKQVFALLVLKRFITENPLESQSGGDTEGTARSSVSRVLTDQLNRLSENVKGVQLSFDVKSYQDYTTGTAQGQTQLQLGVSKTLFNDRLVVKVSGNLDIEGENASQQHSAADYIGDLALEYKITGDGRLRVSGFRNSNYDMIDGELTETGAGLIYIKDYNALSELFKANEKENN